MKAQLLALLNLKRIEEKAYRLEVERDRIPQIISNLQNKLELNRQAASTAKSNLTTAEAKHRQLESDLKEKESLLKHADEKLMQAKSNEEMLAGQKEIENHKAEKAKLDDAILNILKDLEKLKPAALSAEKELSTFESDIQADFKRMNEEKEKLQVLITEQLERKEAAIKNLDRSVLSTYEKVAAAKNGVSIVFVENGKCANCNMKVRPQVYNEILSLTVLHRCPSCAKILLPTTLENIP